MLIPSSARAVNILLATPACERIPTPTIDTLTMSSRVETSRAPIFLAVSFKIFSAFAKSTRFTVNVKSVVPSSSTFWTIISTSMLASLTGDKILEAIPGSSGTPKIVNFASSRLKAIPAMIGCSIVSSASVVMSVPTFSLNSSSNAPSSSLSKLDNTRKGT
ncbi:Uncharacterised protein [Acinetobacter baumannii]|nr:Uncharacterised protein [Acinetobacter baumannii]